MSAKKMSAKKRKKRDKKYPKGYPKILIEHEDLIREVREKASKMSPKEKQELIDSFKKRINKG